MKKTKTAAVWGVLIVAVAVLLWQQQPSEPHITLPFSQLLSDLDANNIASLDISGTQIAVTDRLGSRYATSGLLEPELLEKLFDHGVAVNYGTAGGWGLSSWIGFLIPIVLLLAFLLYFLNKSRANSVNILSLRRSPHREVSATDTRVTFADVGGCEDAKAALTDIIDFLRAPQPWLQAGVRLPRGVLLEGPPGCGKTLLARAVAGETNAKFFLVSGSEFVEMFVGVGAARVRDLFETAIKKAPSVVFIDEIDALGRRRGSGIGSSHDEREQTLNQLLVCLDGFKQNDQVVVLCATNRPDVLDPALVRPGRIDRRVRVPELSAAAREEVLKIQTRGKPVHGVDLKEVAQLTEGFNGARLENLCNEAAVLAVRRSKHEAGSAIRITRDDFIRAMRPVVTQDRRFNKLDSLMIESATQLAEPTGTVRVRLCLTDSAPIEGDVVWADATFLKIRRLEEPDRIVAKRQVQQLEVLEGTDSELLEELQMDKWAMRPSATA